MFEWDDQKRQANIARHGVDFIDVLPLFSHQAALMFEDNRRDYGETRYIMLCPVGQLLFQVAYTWRGNNIRIISARRGNQRERRLYERRKHN